MPFSCNIRDVSFDVPYVSAKRHFQCIRLVVTRPPSAQGGYQHLERKNIKRGESDLVCFHPRSGMGARGVLRAEIDFEFRNHRTTGCQAQTAG